MKNLVATLFFGNLFYGCCALALCIETNLQHGLPLNGPHFYFLVFSATVVFYTRIYYRSRHTIHADERTLWYRQNSTSVRIITQLLLMLMAADAIFLLFKLHTQPGSLQPAQWILLLLVPGVVFLYSVKALPFGQIQQLRTIGWLKPFLIGFAWSGLVNVYPILFRQMQSGIPATLVQFPSLLFWLQNFLFISVLAILFDVKDSHFDIQHHVNTFPALLGVNKTVRLLAVPLSVISAAILLLHGFQQHARLLPQAIQMVPYVLLGIVLLKITKASGILFYLAAIDGLMLVKGLCGILSTLV